jgi:hypothetical protein
VEEAATKADLSSLSDNIATLIQQLGERFDQRFDAVENRLDRAADTLVGVQSQMAGMTRWADRFDRDHSATLATQVAQQRTIDALIARVARLEEQRKAS